MRKNNRKGFTIVELVIVIAVIAILAGVLIPTFSSVVKKANKSAIDQEIAAARTTLLTVENGQLSSDAEYYFIYKKGEITAWYKWEDGKVVDVTADANAKADTNDVVFASAKSQTILEVTADDTATTDVDEATEVIVNADFSANVVVWKQIPNA